MTGFYYGAKYYEAETGTPVTVLGWDPVDGAPVTSDPATSATPRVAKSISDGPARRRAPT